MACPSLLPIQALNMTPTVLLLIEISTAMPKYSIHSSTLTDMAVIEGKIYPRKPYVSKGPPE